MPVDVIEATLTHLNPCVRVMVQFQLLTGCRAGEVMAMRGRDLTPGESNWVYRPHSHKNSWRDQERSIYVGPRAQAVIRPFLKDDPSEFLFSPRDAVAEFQALRRGRRRSKPTPSELRRRASAAGGRHAARYDRRSYRQAVLMACDRAFPHPSLSLIPARILTPEQREELKEWRKKNRWSPLQLRHTAGTLIRAKYGLEVAQVILGHAKADVTQIYAERDLAKAQAVMTEIG